MSPGNCYDVPGSYTLRLPTWRWEDGTARAGNPSRSGPAYRTLSRPLLSKHHPVHVTWRMLPHVWNLRSRRSFRALSAHSRKLAIALGSADPFLRARNHLHLIVEAADAVRLSRGLQGLALRIARRLNRLMGRAGKVFATASTSMSCGRRRGPRAVAYVLGNFFVHTLRRGERVELPHRTSTAPHADGHPDRRWLPGRKPGCLVPVGAAAGRLQGPCVDDRAPRSLRGRKPSCSARRIECEFPGSMCASMRRNPSSCARVLHHPLRRLDGQPLPDTPRRVSRPRSARPA